MARTSVRSLAVAWDLGSSHNRHRLAYEPSSSSSLSLSQGSGGAKRKRKTRSREVEDNGSSKQVIVLSSGDASSSSSVSLSQRSGGGKRKRKKDGSSELLAVSPGDMSSSSLSPSQDETKRRCLQPKRTRTDPPTPPACSLLPPTAQPACSLLPPTAPPACSLLPPTAQPACSLLPPTAKPTYLTYHRAVFEGKYVELGCLGTGGFGAVYAGHRRDDNLPVAIKHIPLAKVRRTPVTLEGIEWLVPREVQLLLQAAGGGGRASVALLDWYELDQELLLVLERPVPSVDLYDYIEERGGVLQEDEAKDLMRQLVLAVIEVHSSGVLHRDIKSGNILVETGSGSPRLRIVDFGCGCALREGLYTDFSGTRLHAPPECFLHAAYEAVPYTVWQLGVMMYDMLCGDLPFQTRRHIIKKEPYIVDYLSGECQDLMRRCLSKNPFCRPTLEEMLLHPWLHQASRPAP